ncbi:MAG TPA: BlaI/MecI/CopY family transcriptional regulator [Candidatus Angelobacter sp.]|jgi:predicted transcriptional regulator|nr:BlaI/MecI/CopY family transcriptional regulator [Candidatus Angelobacter sp.]
MSRSRKPLRTPFTDLDQAIMSSIWQRGSATAEQVREDLAPKCKLKESTVRTLLGRLEKKGFLKHKVEGRAYAYSSIDEPQGFAVRAVRQIIEKFCAGSAEQLIVGMVDDEVLDADQLRRLADEIEKKPAGGKVK